MKKIVLQLLVGLGLCLGAFTAVSYATAEPASASCAEAGLQSFTVNGVNTCVNGLNRTYIPSPYPTNTGSGDWDCGTAGFQIYGQYITYCDNRVTGAQTAYVLLPPGDPNIGQCINLFLTGRDFGTCVNTYARQDTFVRITPGPCVIRQEGVASAYGQPTQTWDYTDGGNCLNADRIGSVNAVCGTASVWMRNSFSYGAPEEASFASSNPCDFNFRIYLDATRTEVIPKSAELLIDAPDALQVGGATRRSSIVASRGNTTCTVRRWTAPSLGDGNYGPWRVTGETTEGCNGQGGLNPRTDNFDFTYSLVPSAGVTACANKSEVGCYYWLANPGRPNAAVSGGANKVKTFQVDSYRATSPGEYVQVGISSPVWQYTRYEQTYPPGSFWLCEYTLLNGISTPCRWTLFAVDPVMTERTGSLTPTMPRQFVRLPIVGALPTPTDERGGTGGN